MYKIGVYNLGDGDEGLIIHGDKYITVEPDLCHYFGKIEETAEFLAMKEMAEKNLVDLNKFVIYWGIKPRMRQNYAILLNTMMEIGIDISNMPKWGER